MNLLKGKKVLLFSWSFYDYPEIISKELERLGAEVEYICSTPIHNTFLSTIFKKVGLKNIYLKNVLRKLDGKADYILIINLKILPEYFINALFEKYPQSKKILYMWDSISNSKVNTQFFDKFDKVFTFDSYDAKKYELINFLPLFYSEGPVKNSENRYDFSFVGVAHSERYNFVKHIKQFAIKNDYTYYFRLYFPTPFTYIYRKYVCKEVREAKMSDFTFTMLDNAEIHNIMDNSRIIIDMELKQQNGLTMRTIETVGKKKKLITTNANIRDYDFYDKNNILVVDRENVSIPVEFVETEYRDIPQDVYEKYSLTSWICTLLGDEDEN